ncbi:MogA/MoaB family molybdenum cofactor biosynthesis protein, partial [Klebsiella pneumoniae]|uniref:MogA/MoaB family molybdenum cofactor biosynthesis protein n=1 Tax=Klebsiella pneumoniae TaxID=573 RepID=UPI003564F2BD
MPIDTSLPFRPVRIAVLTVSDTRGLAEDRSGDALVARIAEAGHELADRRILRDDVDAIVDQLDRWGGWLLYPSDAADGASRVVISLGVVQST